MKLLCLELRRCDRPQQTRMSPLLEVTEDTPPDMLTGSMDLRLVLPDGSRVRMSVDRRTPMMDLLVQVTTAYKISPAGNVLQPYGETGILPYKPSTPIGALDTWIVHIVPKNQALQNPSNKINLKQIIPPFEQTLRFQVNLPRNQLWVTRLSGRCSMRDILLQACNEKNLDPSKYTLRHPKQLDKPLCDEMSIAEYGHNQVTMLSMKNLPTAVSTEDILMMNKYKAQSDSGSGSAASSSVSPVPPVQPPKPLRKRRPAPKPPVAQQKQQQNETIICHSRTSSDSSGYHEASVLSESPDSNNSSLPDSLPRRSKLPPAEPKANTVESKLSRSLSNLHQASTSSSGLKPAQSTSCLVQARKKKPAPPPPVAIAEEKEEKSATLPAGARLLEGPSDQPDTPLTNGIASHDPAHQQVMVACERTKPRAPAPRPRPRSTAFETKRPSTEVAPDIHEVLKKMEESPSLNMESESARLEAEIERMFEQATREHVSLESGVELSRDPSPDWNWEYRLPAPPTFRDDVTTPSLTELQLAANLNSKQILFAPLESMEEVIKEESSTETNHIVNGNANLHIESGEEIHLPKVAEKVDDKISANPVKETISKPNTEIIKTKTPDCVNVNGDVNSKKMNGHVESNLDSSRKINKINKTEKVYITPENNNVINNSSKDIIHINPKAKTLSPQINNKLGSQNLTVKNHKNNQIIEESKPKSMEIKAEKVCINIKNDETQEKVKIIGRAKVERSDTVIRVNGRQERSQEQSAILNELATVITERQSKPRESKSVEPMERPQVLPLKNFSITTYSGSKPVEIYKEKPAAKEPVPEAEVRKEPTAIMRSNSSAEDKKGPVPVKRSASVVTNLQRRLDLSRSNGNLLEADELPLRNFRSTLRKTTSELSINIDPDEPKEMLSKQETGLQSLQVLRTILPQLSQSQGALNTLGQINEKEEKPAVSLTTWGERPKRQVSIKTDRDYVTSGAKDELQASVTVEMVSPAKPMVQADRRPRTSVYRSIETGNTKPIRLPPSDLGRLPIVRAVELKKHPDVKPPEDSPLVAPHFPPAFPSEKPFGLLKTTRAETRQIRPPSYLFGCEPKVSEVPPPPPPAPTLVKLKPVSQRAELRKQPSADPREELLSSIRNFGKSSLRKVSTR